jgi:nucleoside-diphosphate-sugar epimerase
MNILVTGASGGFGKPLIPALMTREKINIRILKHRSPVELPGSEQVSGSLGDLDSLMTATSGIDLVIHLAALTHSPDRDDYFEVNVKGTKNLITACARNKVTRFLYMSSGAAHPAGGAYSESKLQAEQWVKESGLEWTILRPREVYGTGGKEGINQLICWVQKWPVIPVIGDGRYSLSPVFIDDVVYATVEAVFNPGVSGNSYDLAGPEEMAYVALVGRLAAYFGVRRMKFFLPVFWVQAVAWFFKAIKVNALVPDQIPRLLCDKPFPENSAIPILNFYPRKLEDGLRACFPPQD